MVTGVKRIYFILDKVIKVVLIVITLLMLAVAFGQIVARTFTDNPWPWADEFCRFCLIWITFLGTALGIRYGSHIQVDALLRVLPNSAIRPLDKFANLCAIASGVGLLIYGIVLFLSNPNQVSSALHIPLRGVYSVIPISGALICIFSIENILKDRDGSGKERSEL